jgi:hypothetical protein
MANPAAAGQQQQLEHPPCWQKPIGVQDHYFDRNNKQYL